MRFKVIYTDFTELVHAVGKAQMISFIDHLTKLALGWAVGERRDTALALAAWERAKRTLERLGYTIEGRIVHHDQDPVFTSYAWTGQLLLEDQARISYALGGAGDKPEMESFNSRFKNENRSLLLEAPSRQELIKIVDRRMVFYNRRRQHSALGYQAPLAFIEGLRPRR